VTKLRRVIALIAGILVADGALYAHHGRGTRYDMESIIKIQGFVQELVWRNPHVAILIDVPGETGELVTWVIEHSNVSTLARQGYFRNTLRAGDKVSAFIYPITTGDAGGLCQSIVLEDGSVIFVRGESLD
jgi:hypothetical protein